MLQNSPTNWLESNSPSLYQSPRDSSSEAVGLDTDRLFLDEATA